MSRGWITIYTFLFLIICTLRSFDVHVLPKKSVSYVSICEANADAAAGVPCILARLLSMLNFKSDRIPVDFGL